MSRRSHSEARNTLETYLIEAKSWLSDLNESEAVTQALAFVSEQVGRY
jgi:hypothetical protein